MAKHESELMNSAQVCEFFAGISPMSLWRWQNNPDLGFPSPTMIRRRRYWRREEIERFAALQSAPRVAAGA